MSTKDAYKAKIEAEIELAQAKLVTWKAKAKNLSADLRIEFNKEVGIVEKNVNALKSNLKDIANAGEDSWEKLKTSGETALDSIAKYIKSISNRIKE